MPSQAISLVDRLKDALLKRELPSYIDGELIEVLEHSISLWVSLKYPYTNSATDSDEEPSLNWVAQSWVIRCAIEMLGRKGAEGQLAHSENSVNRSFDTATVSESLRREVIPIAGQTK